MSEELKIGSLTGGGRYDNLVGMFLGKDIPATGTTIGLERIIDVMTAMNMVPEAKTMTQVLVTQFDENTTETSMRFVQRLRQSGIKSEIFFDRSNLKKQFNYANQRGIPYVAVIGPDEMKRNEVALKNMTTGEQVSVKEEEAIDRLRGLKS